MASPLQVNKQIAAECASCASPKTGCSDVSLRNGVEISDYSSFRLPSPSSAPTIFQLFTFAVEETSCLRVRGLMTGAKNETKNHAVSKKCSGAAKIAQAARSFPYLGCEEMWLEERRIGSPKAKNPLRLARNETRWLHCLKRPGVDFASASTARIVKAMVSRPESGIEKCRRPEKVAAEKKVTISCNRQM
jgi:hypothetical protein